MTAVEDTTRAQWLSWRRGGIGGSDIASILGISPWGSPWTVWADKCGLIPDEQVDEDDPREFGKRAESMIVPWFSDRTGLAVAGEQAWLTSKRLKWMRCTTDGFVVDGPDGELGVYDLVDGELDFTLDESVLGLLQMKTDFASPWEEIPAHHQAQGQWEMAVADVERLWFAVLHGRRFRTYELERNDDDIAFMIERAHQFWYDHVLTGEPPEIDNHAATARVLGALYPEAVDGKAQAIDDLADEVRVLMNAKDLAASAKETITAVSNRIKAVMGDAREGTVAGQRVLTLGSQTRKTTCQHCGAVDESEPFRVLRPTKEAKEL